MKSSYNVYGISGKILLCYTGKLQCYGREESNKTNCYALKSSIFLYKNSIFIQEKKYLSAHFANSNVTLVTCDSVSIFCIKKWTSECFDFQQLLLLCSLSFDPSITNTLCGNVKYCYLSSHILRKARRKVFFWVSEAIENS